MVLILLEEAWAHEIENPGIEKRAGFANHDRVLIVRIFDSVYKIVQKKGRLRFYYIFIQLLYKCEYNNVFFHLTDTFYISVGIFKQLYEPFVRYSPRL